MGHRGQEDTQDIAPVPAPPAVQVQTRRNYRDAITYTVAITLIVSQLVLQILVALGLLEGEPSITLLTTGVGLLGLPAALHRGDRKEDRT